VAAPDIKVELAERERLRTEQAGSGLEQRLAKLPESHPSGAGYEDGPRPPGGADNRRPERVEPLTDAEYADHLAEVESKLDKARAAGLATHIQYTIDHRHEVWLAARELQHNSIIHEMYDSKDRIPCDRQALVAGGLAGAGKTTVIREYAGIDLGKYLMINPDEIKEQLARRDLIPDIGGLSPMEAVALAHEESSHLAKRLAQRALADGKNVIWDITMSSSTSTERRIDALRSAGYTRVDGLFVDIPPDISICRSETRHREGLEDHRNGLGLGGRYVAREIILAQVDPEWGSLNRRVFEELSHRFDAWWRYDNSAAAPFLADAGGHSTIERGV
jgi:predicted ABC-type ATPase